MKRIIQLLILLILSTVVYSQQLTNEQVIQMVKDYENNQNLSNLTVSYMNGYESNPGFYQVCLTNYSINLSKTWFVYDNIGVTTYINNPEIYMGNDLVNNDYSEGNVNYTKEQCKTIGLNYLNNKNISLIGCVNEPIVSWENNGCYKFAFYKLIDADLDLRYISVVICVNAFTGNIARCKKSLKPIFTIVNRPSLTIPQVIQIVQQNFDNIQSNQIKISNYYINNTNDSIYRDAHVGDLGVAEIDAYTHEIVKFNVYGGATINSNNPSFNKLKITPAKSSNGIKILTKEDIENMGVENSSINLILYNTENPKEIKYTKLSNNYKINKDDKGIARMEVNGNKFIFRNGSYWCFINNKTYNMGGNCIIENGKLKLPEEFYKKVQDKDYQFFKK
ncbi:MAG: hypothetical protein IJS60_08430 [Abditibacteriota bacterium]|nr:hypothetical protein [Abditibacteriota bacterium]